MSYLLLLVISYGILAGAGVHNSRGDGDFTSAAQQRGPDWDCQIHDGAGYRRSATPAVRARLATLAVKDTLVHCQTTLANYDPVIRNQQAVLANLSTDLERVVVKLAARPEAKNQTTHIAVQGFEPSLNAAILAAFEAQLVAAGYVVAHSRLLQPPSAKDAPTSCQFAATNGQALLIRPADNLPLAPEVVVCHNSEWERLL